ncbi:MAG: hypothetical protein LUC16_00410 [Coprobacillus sp.]|nr:hypothetical protein [Coprobacillus sp.]
MKRNASKFICLAIAPLMALCSCGGYSDTKDWTMYLPLSANIRMSVCDEDENEIYLLKDDGDYSITLTIEKTYVVWLYHFPSYGVKFTDWGYVFEYEKEYLDIQDYDPEMEWDNKWTFVGLKETEETTMVIHNESIKESKTVKITLVSPETDDQESII